MASKNVVLPIDMSKSEIIQVNGRSGTGTNRKCPLLFSIDPEGIEKPVVMPINKQATGMTLTILLNTVLKNTVTK